MHCNWWISKNVIWMLLLLLGRWLWLRRLPQYFMVGSLLAFLNHHTLLERWWWWWWPRYGCCWKPCWEYAMCLLCRWDFTHYHSRNQYLRNLFLNATECTLSVAETKAVHARPTPLSWVSPCPCLQGWFQTSRVCVLFFSHKSPLCL